MKSTIVKQNDEAKVPTEVLADSIVAISAGIKKLRGGRLNEKALLLLIQHAAPTIASQRIPISEIRHVLDGIEALEKTYLKKKA